jgi:predicted enzyme related to lactoylglutathione lyase
MERVSGIGGIFFRARGPEVYPNGRFAHLADPEGNPVQLWEVAGE